MISAHLDASLWYAAADEIRKGLPRSMRGAVTETAEGGVKIGRGSAPVLSGRLRDSIIAHPPQPTADGWEVMIGPTGERVSLYSKKEENRAHFMASALAYVREHLADAGVSSIKSEIRFVD